MALSKVEIVASQRSVYAHLFKKHSARTNSLECPRGRTHAKSRPSDASLVWQHRGRKLTVCFWCWLVRKQPFRCRPNGGRSKKWVYSTATTGGGEKAPWLNLQHGELLLPGEEERMPPADRPIDLSRPRCRSLAAQRRRYVEEHGLWLRRRALLRRHVWARLQTGGS